MLSILKLCFFCELLYKSWQWGQGNRQKDLLGHLGCDRLCSRSCHRTAGLSQHRSPTRDWRRYWSFFVLSFLSDLSVHSSKLFPASSPIQFWHRENHRRSQSLRDISPFMSGVQSRAWPPGHLRQLLPRLKILSRHRALHETVEATELSPSTTNESRSHFPSTSGFQPFGYLPQNNCSAPLSS